ncbi:MAG TPA: hypothetical protein VKE51_06995 [Vicinamibacterales bacterium]|nr:hypothetical protein [Vicinamibacterales bacterium]
MIEAFRRHCFNGHEAPSDVIAHVEHRRTTKNHVTVGAQLAILRPMRREADLAEQRAPAADLSCVSGAQVEARDVADVQTHVLVVGAREGRTNLSRF